MPTIYDSNVKMFENWKKRIGLDNNRRKLLVRDVQIRTLREVPESIFLENPPVGDRYVCEPGEHILILFDEGVMVVRDES